MTARRLGAAAIALLVLGLVLLVGPPLLRDGICGLVGCAEQTPDIAVTRTAPDELAVLVPAAAAPSVRSVRLLESGGGGGQLRWSIRRDGAAARAGSAETAFVVGSEPAGFRTTTPLEAPVGSGTYQAEVIFSCTTASLPFSPDSVGLGQVRSWAGVTDGSGFSSAARTTETCGREPSSAERALVLVGAVLATLGAVLGIVWVFRRPPRDDDPFWSDPFADDD